MFEEGTIVYFNLFHFTNSTSDSKPKYFIVIKQIDNITILAGLPSSQKHLPYNLQSTYGCINVPDSGIGCYVFQAGVAIATNGFSFPCDSYIYGQHLDEYEIQNINDLYPLESVDYEILGQLVPTKLEEVVDCLKGSSSVKRRFRRYLS